MKYFLINKQMDYDRGFLQGLEYRDGRLRLAQDAGPRGWFFSRVFDSREEGTVWHRFTVDTGRSGGAGLRISFYSFDSEELVVDGRKLRVSELVRSGDIPPEQKKRALEPYRRVQTAGSRDVLLHEAEGRYLVVLLELSRREADNSVGDMCLFFPKETWLRYLPGVYSRDAETADFSGRFLGIFQSFYNDREMEIRTGAGLIHPSAVNRELLEGLAGWYDLKDLYLWPDDRLRELVRRAPELTQKRGTAAGMKEYLRLYLGVEPVIREDPDDPWSFTVLVPEEYTEDTREYRSLLRIIGHMKPAGMNARVAAADRRDHSGEDMHLGMNSRLEGADGGKV